MHSFRPVSPLEASESCFSRDMSIHKCGVIYLPDQFEDLEEDIRKNGVLEPVVLYEDKVLDGYHRYMSIFRCRNSMSISKIHWG